MFNSEGPSCRQGTDLEEGSKDGKLTKPHQEETDKEGHCVRCTKKGQRDRHRLCQSGNRLIPRGGSEPVYQWEVVVQ